MSQTRLLVQVLPPRHGVSALLTLKRRALDVTLGRLVSTDSSLSLAETSTVGSLVGPAVGPALKNFLWRTT
jgi:hypothetical protein